MGQATRLIHITSHRFRLGRWTLLLLRERRAQDDDHDDHNGGFVASGRTQTEQEALGQALAAIYRNGTA
jgi:hypothetical protein